MKNLVALILCFTLVNCQNQKACSEPEFALEKNREEVDKFLTQWHNDAANGNNSYFQKMAKNGVYIGTDKSERWPRDEFKSWAKPYFEEGRGWDFNAQSRNINFSESGDIAWADELLDTWMGTCRGSVVLSRRDSGWAVELYHLSVTVPNDTLQTILEVIKAYEKNPIRKDSIQ